jgi:hypothetical protein
MERKPAKKQTVAEWADAHSIRMPSGRSYKKTSPRPVIGVGGRVHTPCCQLLVCPTKEAAAQVVVNRIFPVGIKHG